jgi:hypothetical protein
MFRVTVLTLGGLAAFPALGAAQFTPAMVPPNPLYQHPAYRFQFNLGTSVPTSFGRTFVGVTFPFTRAPQMFSPNWGQPTTMYGWSGSSIPSSGYISGSFGRYDTSDVQLEFRKAQREAAVMWGRPDAAKNLIADQGAYEKIGLAPGGPGALKIPAGDALARSLQATTEADVASGEALNHILAAVISAEAKGGKGPSAFLPPQVIGEVRFAGPAGEALNLLRVAGRLPVPAAFDAPQLRDLRVALERDFAAAAAPLLSGKPSEGAKVAALEATIKKLEAAAPPVIRELSFEDAIAARRFLNHLAATVRTLRAGGSSSLVNAAWATEGTSVADLVKHMARHKIQFGPAGEGGEPAYLAVHRGLATYLFVISQPKK